MAITETIAAQSLSAMKDFMASVLSISITTFSVRQDVFQ